MAYIVHGGKLEHSEDFDLLGEYAKKHRTRVTTVEVWGFERLPIGQLCVRWANGCIGFFVGESMHSLREYVESLPGWPKPTVYSRGLPFSAGVMFMAPSVEEKEVEHETQRVVRQRDGDSIRRKRTRAEAIL